MIDLAVVMWNRPLIFQTDQAPVRVWPMEKQRRSSIDWYALVPDDVAYDQIRWERRQTVRAMREAGMTQKEIGLRFDLTKESIRQYEVHAHRSAASSPVEEYFARPVLKPWRRGQGPELATD